MTLKKKMSLWTLAGLVLPFGNVWGPYLTRLPEDTDDRSFRSKLVLFELCFTLIFLAVGFYLYYSAMVNNMKLETLIEAAYMPLIQGVVIIAVALGLFFCLPSDEK